MGMGTERNSQVAGSHQSNSWRTPVVKTISAMTAPSRDMRSVNKSAARPDKYLRSTAPTNRNDAQQRLGPPLLEKATSPGQEGSERPKEQPVAPLRD